MFGATSPIPDRLRELRGGERRSSLDKPKEGEVTKPRQYSGSSGFSKILKKEQQVNNLRDQLVDISAILDEMNRFFVHLNASDASAEWISSTKDIIKGVRKAITLRRLAHGNLDLIFDIFLSEVEEQIEYFLTVANSRNVGDPGTAEYLLSESQYTSNRVHQLIIRYQTIYEELKIFYEQVDYVYFYVYIRSVILDDLKRWKSSPRFDTSLGTATPSVSKRTMTMGLDNLPPRLALSPRFAFPFKDTPFFSEITAELSSRSLTRYYSHEIRDLSSTKTQIISRQILRLTSLCLDSIDLNRLNFSPPDIAQAVFDWMVASISTEDDGGTMTPVPNIATPETYRRNRNISNDSSNSKSKGSRSRTNSVEPHNEDHTSNDDGENPEKGSHFTRASWDRLNATKLSCDEELGRLKGQLNAEMSAYQDQLHVDVVSQSVVHSSYYLSKDESGDLLRAYMQLEKLIDRLVYTTTEEISDPETCLKMLREGQDLLSIHLNSGRNQSLSTSVAVCTTQENEKWSGRTLVIKFLLILSRLSRLVEPISLPVPEARSPQPENFISLKQKYRSLAVSPTRDRPDYLSETDMSVDDDSASIQPTSPQLPDIPFETPVTPIPHENLEDDQLSDGHETPFSASLKKGGMIFQKLVSWFKSPSVSMGGATDTEPSAQTPVKHPATPPPSTASLSREYIMCRICEEKVIAQDLQTHSEVCMKTSRWESLLKTFDEYLQRTMTALNETIKSYEKTPSQPPHTRRDEFEALILLNTACSKILSISIDHYSRDQSKYDDEFQKVIACTRSWRDDARFFRVQALLHRVYEIAIEKQTLCRNAIRQGLYKPGKDSHRHPRTPKIQDFQIIKLIKSGGFGKVFLAKKKTTGDIYAIKVLKKEDMMRKNQVRNIKTEQKILGATKNDFLVRLYYSFSSKDYLYLVMEYMIGGDLDILLQAYGAFEEDMARHYAAEIFLALQYLHSKNIIHRDLKPDNLLISKEGHVKLTDFGLSHIGVLGGLESIPSSTDYDPGFAVSSASPRTFLLTLGSPKGNSHLMPSPMSATRTIPTSDHFGDETGLASRTTRRRDKGNSFVGTPDYIAPEIILGTGHSFSADWWSFGVLLYEFIIGCPPFNAPTTDEIFSNILQNNLVWPDEVYVSFEASDLITRLLTLDPSKRLGSRSSDEIKNHPFFRDVRWDTVLHQEPPFVPNPVNAEDTGYFEVEESAEQGHNPNSRRNLSLELKDIVSDVNEQEQADPTNNSDVYASFTRVHYDNLGLINGEVIRRRRLSGSNSVSSSPHNL